MSRKVLITGSSGFIGSHLIGYLNSQGYDTLGLDIKAPASIESSQCHVICDILDLDNLRTIFIQFKPEVVIHLAARTDLNEVKSLDGYAANIDGTMNLIQVIEDSGCVKRALFTSSQLVCRVGYIPKSEFDYNPSNLYGKSKILTETIVRESALSNIAWCLLRPTTIWGEGMSAHYQRFIRMVKNGRYLHIGHADLFKSYGYIGNTIYQFRQFIEAPDSLIHEKTFYLADYQPLSLREWADCISVEFGSRKIKTVPVPIARIAGWVGDGLAQVGFRGFPFNSFRLNNVLTEYVFDLSLTENICGPLPFSMKEGVARTACWFVDLDKNKKN